MSNENHVIRGVAHWAKIIGAPRLNEFTGEKEWSIDVTPNKEGRALLKKLGINDRLREPKDGDKREESFISFRHREKRKDGSLNDPLRIVNADNDRWGNFLIGNGSVVDAKFVVKDYGKGKKKGVYLRAIRILEHVPYEVEDFAPLESDDEYFASSGETEAEQEETTSRSPQTVLQALDADDEEELDDDFPSD